MKRLQTYEEYLETMKTYSFVPEDRKGWETLQKRNNGYYRRSPPMLVYVDNLRLRFKKLREARDHGCGMTPERIWDVWKVQVETWSHEYWLLTLELKQIKIERELYGSGWDAEQTRKELATPSNTIPRSNYA